MDVKYKYEDAIERLEIITSQLEKGDLSLEDALTFFEEGIKLVKICSSMLDEAEGKIQVLVKDMSGDFEFKDFYGGMEDIGQI